MTESNEDRSSPSRDEEIELSNGTRLRCTRCHSEAIVTAAGAATLHCCATPMEVTFSRSSAGTQSNG